MRYPREPAALVNEPNGLAKRPQHGDVFVDEQRQEMTRARRDFDADDYLDASATASGELAHRHGRSHRVMVRQRDDIEVRPGLDVVEDLLQRIEAVSGVGVDLEVSLTHAGGSLARPDPLEDVPPLRRAGGHGLQPRNPPPEVLTARLLLLA